MTPPETENIDEVLDAVETSMPPIEPQGGSMEDYPEDLDADEVGDEEPAAPRPRGPRRGQRGRRMPPRMPRDEARQKELARLQGLEFDDWVAQFDWNQPQMKMILKRIGPAYYQGVKTAGHLDDRSGTPYTLEEIRNQYQGGDYEAIISGPRFPGDPNPTTRSRKRFSIAGEPAVNMDTLPADARQQAARGGARAPAQADATKGLLDIVSSEVSTLRNQIYSGGAGGRADGNMEQMRSTYTDAMKEIKESAEARAEAREASASERAKIAQEWADRERKEREELQKRVTDMEKETAEKIRSSQGDSLNLIATMLPQLQMSTQEQLRIITGQFEAREERLAAQHQAAVNQLNSMNAMQLQAQASAHEAQIRNLETMHASNATLLKGQIQNLQSEKEQLLRQLEDARRVVEEVRKDLMNHVTSAKPKSSMDQLTEIAGVMNAVNDLKASFGGGGEVEPGDGLDDNPIAKNIFRVLNKGAESLPAILEAYSASKQAAAQPALQPQMLPQGYPAPGYPGGPGMMPPGYPAAAAPQARRSGPAAPQRPATPPPPQPSRLRREDLQQAMIVVNAALAQTEPPPAALFAQGAVAKVDNGVLRELARRKPEKVLEQLGAAGMLQDRLATAAGQEYLTHVLEALKTILG